MLGVQRKSNCKHQPILLEMRREDGRKGRLKMGYQPKIILGKVKNTGYPIDGLELLFSLWDYDNYESYHLSGWREDADEAVMKTIFQSEKEAGLCLYDALEDFARAWKSGEYEPDGVFCLAPENVDVVVVMQDEKDGDNNG